ncbi:MAG: hypothetical protein GF411_03970 [Candidatus Lokiarchaeota archaeon]|nr:hypothetical protein [Candidatus Lokiarchaeota archaeon]
MSDFEEKSKTPTSKSKKKKTSTSDIPRPRRLSRKERHPSQLWKKTLINHEDWAVVDLDGTVLFVQLINGRIHAHGREAFCRWCSDSLEIRDTRVFCAGKCGRYQGKFSQDLKDYFHWDGAKSYTLRKKIAEIEGLELPAEDHEPIQYAPNWSVLDQYEEGYYEEL